MLHIGTSGWYYQHWQDSLYRKVLKSKWFAHYASIFNTVELNNSFYRFPTVATVLRWRQQAPANFIYSVKMHRSITHSKLQQASSRDGAVKTAQLAKDFYQVIAGLDNKLGCVLFQFPAHLEYSVANLQRLLDLVDPSFNNVFEFRHASWWCEEVYAALSDSGVSFGSVNGLGMPDELINTSETLYLRLHGKIDHNSRYTDKQLLNLVDAIKRQAATNNINKLNNIYCYFNNDGHGNAAKNALRFTSMM